MALPDQPLDDARLSILAEELLIHTRAATAHFNSLLGLLADARRHRRHPESVAFWTNLQSFLMHAGMVSKFLNPVHVHPAARDAAETNQFRDWRSAQIRSLIGNIDTSALDARSARNFVEHIDENIDPWLTPQPQPTLIRKVYSTLAECDEDEAGFWTRVFVEEGALFCFDHRKDGRQKIPLQPIHSALEAIDDACATFWARIYGPELRL